MTQWTKEKQKRNEGWDLRFIDEKWWQKYMEGANNLLSIKFMIANVGPMLSTVLKVSKLMRPLLKAMTVKACNKWQNSFKDEQDTLYLINKKKKKH